MEDNVDKTNQAPLDPPSQRDLFFQEEEVKDVLTQANTDSGESADTLKGSSGQILSADTEEKKSGSDPFPQKKVRALRHLQVSPQATPGQLLTQAREMASMDLAEVAEITRIRSDYLKALEEDDKTRLPSSRVFVQSYIRACMDVYQLDKDSREQVLERFFEEEKDLVEDVPEKVLEHIGKDGQISEEEAQRVRMICIYGGVIALLLLSLIITSIVAVSIRNSRAGKTVEAEQPVKRFDSGKIETLLAPQIPDPVILQHRKKGAEQK